MDQLLSLFCLFSFFSNTIFTEKTVAFSRIRTQFVGVVGEHADNLTTAQDFTFAYLDVRDLMGLWLQHDPYQPSHVALVGLLPLSNPTQNPCFGTRAVKHNTRWKHPQLYYQFIARVHRPIGFLKSLSNQTIWKGPNRFDGFRLKIIGSWKSFEADVCKSNETDENFARWMFWRKSFPKKSGADVINKF